MTAPATVAGAALERPTGRAPARRAVIRWALRLFRREWRQQLIMITLVVVAEAATLLGAAVATNVQPPAHAGFGTADHLVSLPGGAPRLAADIAAVRHRFGAVDVIENRTLATGLAQPAQLRAQDPAGRFGTPMLRLVSGRYPRGVGEVALTRRLARTVAVSVGATWHADGRTLRVVGLVENPQNLLDTFALVPPGQLRAPTQVTVLFRGGAAAAGFTVPDGYHAVAPPHRSGFAPALIVLAVAIVGLIFIGLVSAAGFTVLAQRRLRALGMLSALGATDRDVRLVMIANGAAVGVVGALIGAVLGFAVWIPYAPHLSVSAGHRISWTQLPWWLVGGSLVLAVATAILASRRPARAVANTSVLTALSGRPAPPRGAHRSAVPGALILALGVVMLAFSGGWGANGGKNALLQLGGLIACAVGLLMFAPIAVAMMGPAARHAPIGVRIALRDLARYRARAGASLAATSFAVLIAMLVTLITTGRYNDPVDYFGPNLPANQLILDAGGSPSAEPPGTATPASVSPVTQRQTMTEIARSLRATDALPLEASDASLTQRSDGGFRSGPGTVYVATPALLAHYGIDAHTIDPRTELLTSRRGLAGTPDLALLFGPPESARIVGNLRIQTVDALPTDTATPNLVITEAAAARLGMHASLSGWLITAPASITAAQANTARQLALAAGLRVEIKSDAPSLSQVRNYATTAGILIALGILAMTVGLVRSQTTGEIRTLTATGASSRIRRTIAASTAGALAVLAAVLGTAVAYLATTAFFRNQLSERMANPPVTDLLLILIGMPLAAMLSAWVFAGRQPPAIARQPIE